MAAVGGSAGSYGALIITPDLVPPDAADWDAQKQTYQTGAQTWTGIHEQIVRDNTLRRGAASSRGFDEAHRAGVVLAEEALTVAEWHAGVAHKCQKIADVLRDIVAAQRQLVRDADAEIARAKLPGEAQALLAQYQGYARFQTEAAVAAAMAEHTSFAKSPQSTRAQALLAKWGAADPTAGPHVRPASGGGGGKGPHVQPVGNGGEDPYAQAPMPVSETPTPRDPPVDAAGAPVKNRRAGGGGEATAPPGDDPPEISPLGGGLPLLPGSGARGGGMMPSGGGMPGGPGTLGGGGLSGMPGSPLANGLGQVSGGAGGVSAGGGVPGAAAGAGSPTAAFSRGMSTGAGIAEGATMPTAAGPASPSSALTAGGGGAPSSAVSGGGGGGPLNVQSGMVTPAAPAGGATAGVGAGAPMMLPPGSMGPPAAATPPPAAPTMPAGTLGPSSASAPPPQAPAAGGAGATLIPASVVAAGQTAAAQERRESADARAAKELAWKLQHAAQAVGYPIEWAVGVFRSRSGNETVITSNDGASYIPAGVYVPRSARVIAADPLVDDHFRQRWFGWADPARVLIEYAQIRAETGWRLVAAASTGAVNALRDAGVEHPPSCTRQSSPLLAPGRNAAAPSLDGMHVHRLDAVWPEVYPRLLRVMQADPMYQDRIVARVSAVLVESATTQATAVDGGIPDAIRLIWMTRGGNRDPSARQWADYDQSAKDFNILTSIFRPGFSGADDPSETTEELRRYRAHWLVARTAEHVGGWATRPLPLPDMCYAAASAAGRGNVRELVAEALASVEEDLGIR